VAAHTVKVKNTAVTSIGNSVHDKWHQAINNDIILTLIRGRATGSNSTNTGK